MKRRLDLGWRIVGWLIIFVGMVVSLGAAPPPPEGSARVRELLAVDEAQIPWPIHTLDVEGGEVTVCLEVPAAKLRADAGMGAERVETAVARALTPLDWEVLHVRAWDATRGRCRALSDFLPAMVPATTAETPSQPLAPAPARPTDVPQGLAGKTVYISAGHGWWWNSWAWRTQRIVYQGFIEDHNNAEAVDQFLIPYLEQAGATVIPLRERDWNTARVIAKEDAGAWAIADAPGYAGGVARVARTVTGTATMTAAWTLTVPQAGDYALYAWIHPGAAHAPDAHYRVHHAGGVAEVWLDQRLYQPTWRYLGAFPITEGLTVTLDNHSVISGALVAADALRVGGGSFDSFAGLQRLTQVDTTPPAPPHRPWWEVDPFYFSQWMGLDPADFSYFNTIVSRPMFARWHHKGSGEDALFISWHTNGWNGTTRGAESYIHDGSTYPRTAHSELLQQAVHDELIHDIRAGWEVDWIDRGKKQRNLGELRMLWDEDPTARMPGVLLEIAFHDHPEDAAALKDPRFNQLAARAVYQGVVRYFEARDGIDLIELPEPPTHLRAENLGGGAVRVSWLPPETDAIGLRGAAATGYRLAVSRDGFAWQAPLEVATTAHTLTGLAPGEALYLRVTATNAGGESFPTEVLGVRVGAPNLLIVNGFDKLNNFGLVEEDDPVEGKNLRMWLAQMNRRDYVVHHGEAVPARYAWDSASNEAVADGLVDLDAYTMVDWILGEESLDEAGTLSEVERAALRAFVENDGALFISGAELAWDLEAMARDTDFLREVLHTVYVADDAETYTVTPETGGAFEGLETIAFDAAGEYDADFPDVLGTIGGARVALRYAYVAGAGGAAAIQSAAGCRRTMVWGFPFETVRAASRPEVMARVMDFLDDCALLDTQIASPREGAYVNAVPPFEGSASGAELERVEVQVIRAADGAGWTGSAWGAPAWLTATGVFTWSYALPSPAYFTEGAYLLRARAIGPEADPSPAEVSFFYDVVPPLSPTLRAPLDRQTLSLATAILVWDAPMDDGAPLRYELELDGDRYQTEDTFYAVEVTPGEHTWRVRAVDAAGNIGPWSRTAIFTFEAPVARAAIYLPLVGRNVFSAPMTCALVLDAGFEAVDTWEYNALAQRVNDVVYAGDWAARVGIPPGDPGAAAYSSVAHRVTLPADAAAITLDYMAYPINEASDTGDMHYVSLLDAAGTVHMLSTATSDARVWEVRSLDLTAFAGQEVKLYLGVKNDGDDDTAALYVDEVWVQVCK